MWICIRNRCVVMNKSLIIEYSDFNIFIYFLEEKRVIFVMVKFMNFKVFVVSFINIIQLGMWKVLCKILFVSLNDFRKYVVFSDLFVFNQVCEQRGSRIKGF